MTDSELRAGGKRERLVAAAVAAFYAHGVATTSLADIAQAAGIPVGNVYYYFKAKSDIVAAVIDAHVQQIRAQLAAIEAAHAAPRERLKALFTAMAGESDLIAQFGCPLGSLCQEISKHEEGESAPDASGLMRLPLDWCGQQFRAMGRDDAAELAAQAFAAYQGTALLSSALRDPGLLERESRRIAAWVDSL
jgi:TetR/AcrR family transcriptional repressor of nem operon